MLIKYKLSIIICLTLLVPLMIFAKTKKEDEQRFQLGMGITLSSCNLLNLIEDAKLYESIKNDTDYSFTGLDEDEQEALNEISGAMKRAILVANILGGMEYGLQFRILYKIMLFETDVTLLPFDGSYNGRIDLLLSPMIGVRAPFFIMPYIITGVCFTFQFYPSEFTSKEEWKGDWAATNNFAFRPGLNTRIGLDLKIKGFSIGAYYQWTVKDFQEFTSWYWHIVDTGYSGVEAGWKIFAAQSRFGIAISLYVF